MEHVEGSALDGLMTLRNFADGEFEAMDAKVLVVVKSVGPRKRGRSSRALQGETDY